MLAYAEAALEQEGAMALARAMAALGGVQHTVERSLLDSREGQVTIQASLKAADARRNEEDAEEATEEGGVVVPSMVMEEVRARLGGKKLKMGRVWLCKDGSAIFDVNAAQVKADKNRTRTPVRGLRNAIFSWQIMRDENVWCIVPQFRCCVPGSAVQHVCCRVSYVWRLLLSRLSGCAVQRKAQVHSLYACRMCLYDAVCCGVCSLYMMLCAAGYANCVRCYMLLRMPIVRDAATDRRGSGSQRPC